MEISVAEAARLSGCTTRAIRHRIARGDLKARRDGRVWWIDRASLPLTQAQHMAQQARADQVREVVENALPSRVAIAAGDRRRSLADVAAFRRAAEVAAGLLQAASPAAQAAHQDVEELMEAFAEAAFLYDASERAACLNRARRALGRAVGRVVRALGDPPDPALLTALTALEREIYPALIAQARYTQARPSWSRR